MQEGNENGYIVKLYRALLSDYSRLDYEKFDFISWMNFTGIKIIPIDKFSDFESGSFNQMAEDSIFMNTHFERQKILIYNSEEIINSDSYYDSIFEDCLNNDLNSKSLITQYPLLTMIMINFYDSANIDFNNLKAFLDKDLKNIIPNSKYIWKIFHTLSSSDCVLIIRSNSLKALLLSVCAIRNQSFVQSTYTISALSNYSFKWWKCSEQIPVSIRFTLTSQTTFLDFKEAFEKYNQKYTTLGKYDILVEGDLLSIENLYKLLNHEDFVSDEYKKKLIQVSSTRFKIELDEVIKQIGTSEKYEGDFEKPDTLLLDETSLIRELDKIHSNSIKNTLIRLIFRAKQDIITSLEKKSKQIVDPFNLFINLCANSMPNISAIENGVNYFNTYFDNREDILKIEFENPKSNYRFIGAGVKMLEAYSEIVSFLFEKCVNRSTERLNAPFKPFVIADMTTRITVDRIFPHEQLLCVIIPIEMLFDVKHVLAWLVHEAGHFCKLGWTYEDRNLSFLFAVQKGCRELIQGISNESTSEIHGDVCLELKGKLLRCCFCNKNSCNKYDSVCKSFIQKTGDISNLKLWIEKCDNKHLKDFADQLSLHINNEVLHDFFIERSKDIPKTQEDNIYIQTGLLIDVFYRAYREAVADVFMIAILNISQISDYIDTISAYFCYRGSISDLTLAINRTPNICIRTCAVCALIQKQTGLLLDRDTESPTALAKKMREFFNHWEQGDDSVSKLLYTFLSESDSQKTYASHIHAAHNLYTFLEEKCYPAIMKTLSDFSIDSDLNTIRDVYRQLNEPNSFVNHINFLKKYHR